MKPFSKDEDMKMIHYIVKYGIFSVLKGNTVWKIIEKTVYRHSRTWSSLKDRFHKSVLPRLESYGLSVRTIERLRRGVTGQESSDPRDTSRDFVLAPETSSSVRRRVRRKKKPGKKSASSSSEDERKEKGRELRPDLEEGDSSGKADRSEQSSGEDAEGEKTRTGTLSTLRGSPAQSTSLESDLTDKGFDSREENSQSQESETASNDSFQDQDQISRSSVEMNVSTVPDGWTPEVKEAESSSRVSEIIISQKDQSSPRVPSNNSSPKDQSSPSCPAVNTSQEDKSSPRDPITVHVDQLPPRVIVTNTSQEECLPPTMAETSDLQQDQFSPEFMSTKIDMERAGGSGVSEDGSGAGDHSEEGGDGCVAEDPLAGVHSEGSEDGCVAGDQQAVVHSQGSEETDESLDLPPVAEGVGGEERRRRRKRKTVDERTEFSRAVIVQQMEDFSSLERREDLASRTVLPGDLLHRSGRSTGHTLSRLFQDRMKNVFVAPSFSDEEGPHSEGSGVEGARNSGRVPGNISLWRNVDARFGENEEEEVLVIRGMKRKFETIIESSSSSAKRLRIIGLDSSADSD